MNETLKATCDFIREMSHHSTIKASRGYADLLADRIVQAGTQPNLLAFGERLCALMGVTISESNSRVVAAFLPQCGGGAGVLQWLRKYPKVAAMLCLLNREDYEAAVAGIEIDEAVGSGKAIAAGEFDIPLTIFCQSPLAHGADTKAGNATLFRRISVLSDTGSVLTLPIYSGNAIRGMLRDLLADHFLSALGLTPSRTRPPVALWFFHVMYSGGCLEEGSTLSKIKETVLTALSRILGGHGTAKCTGITAMRDTLPPLSLLGAALGNRILGGRINVCDGRPRCRQWGTGEQDVSELFDWVYLTRHEDYEAWGTGEEDDAHTGMIANTEVLKAGVILDAGICIGDHISDVERACLGRGLELLREAGRLGAQNARGLGQVAIEVGNCPDAAAYGAYLAEHKAEILDFLASIKAIERQGELCTA